METEPIDFGLNGGFRDIGEVLTIDINNDRVDVEIAGFMSPEDIAARAVTLINAAQTGFHVTAAIDENDASSIVLTSRHPGISFSADVLVTNDLIDDQIALFRFSTVGPGNTFGLMIDSTPIGLPAGVYAVEFDTDPDTTFNNLVEAHAAAILANHDLIAEVLDGVLALTRANAPVDGAGPLAGGPLGSFIAYQSDATVEFTVAQFPKCMHGLLIAAASQARGDALPTMPMRWNHRR